MVIGTAILPAPDKQPRKACRRCSVPRRWRNVWERAHHETWAKGAPSQRGNWWLPVPWTCYPKWPSCHVQAPEIVTKMFTITYFIRGSITVRLISCLTGKDLTKLVNLYLLQHKQSSWILTSQKVGQLYLQWYFPVQSKWVVSDETIKYTLLLNGKLIW